MEDTALSIFKMDKKLHTFPSENSVNEVAKNTNNY